MNQDENNTYKIDIDKLPLLDESKDMTSSIYNFYTRNELISFYKYKKDPDRLSHLFNIYKDRRDKIEDNPEYYGNITDTFANFLWGRGESLTS